MERMDRRYSGFAQRLPVTIENRERKLARRRGFRRRRRTCALVVGEFEAEGNDGTGCSEESRA